MEEKDSGGRKTSVPHGARMFVKSICGSSGLEAQSACSRTFFTQGGEQKHSEQLFNNKSVLQKWRNKSPRRFHPPVANRVQKIRELPQHHIPTDDHPNWVSDLQLVHLQVNYGDLQRSQRPSGQRSATEDRRLCPLQVVRGKQKEMPPMKEHQIMRKSITSGGKSKDLLSSVRC